MAVDLQRNNGQRPPILHPVGQKSNIWFDCLPRRQPQCTTHRQTLDSILFRNKSGFPFDNLRAWLCVCKCRTRNQSFLPFDHGVWWETCNVEKLFVDNGWHSCRTPRRRGNGAKHLQTKKELQFKEKSAHSFVRVEKLENKIRTIKQKHQINNKSTLTKKHLHAQVRQCSSWYWHVGWIVWWWAIHIIIIIIMQQFALAGGSGRAVFFAQYSVDTQVWGETIFALLLCVNADVRDEYADTFCCSTVCARHGYKMHPIWWWAMLLELKSN